MDEEEEERYMLKEEERSIENILYSESFIHEYDHEYRPN